MGRVLGSVLSEVVLALSGVALGEPGLVSLCVEIGECGVLCLVRRPREMSGAAVGSDVAGKHLVGVIGRSLVVVLRDGERSYGLCCGFVGAG